MDRILNRVYSISNHPVADLDDCFRITYVKGLASCLFTLSQNSEIIKLVLAPYAQSILGEIPYDNNYWREDKSAAKAAISIQHRGFKFFSMKFNWFFDVFYLLQACSPHGSDHAIASRIYSYLNNNICNVFTRGALKYVYQHITENTPSDKISPSILKHKSINDSFLEQDEKKVLIVANVSAGKSTLINSLTGYRTNKARTTSCTSKIGYIYNKPDQDGITAMNDHKDYFYISNVKDISNETYQACALHFNSSLSARPICFIDTPGLNNVENGNHKRITESAIKSGDYDAVIYVSNCQYFGTNDEHEILVTLKKEVRKPIIFVLNQLDRFKQKEDSISKMLNDYKSDLLKMGFATPIIVPVSARAALFLKESVEDMDEDDAEDRREYYCRFQKPFFNLPSYSGITCSDTPLEWTGIRLLEDTVSEILFSK